MNIKPHLDLDSPALANLSQGPTPAEDGAGRMRRVDVKQVKAARELLGWSQQDLVVKSEVGISTIKLIESKTGPLTGSPETRFKIMLAFEKAGVEFLNNGLGVRLLQKPKRTRKKKS